MYIALSLLVCCFMVASATLQLALWQFWALYPIYCFVIFKAVDGIPFWQLNESKLVSFLTKIFALGGLAWYYFIIIGVNIVWWQVDSKVWLYHFADGAWRLLAPAFDKPDLVFSTLIHTEHADFSQKAKFMYSLFLLFFLLTFPFYFGLYSWRRSRGVGRLRDVMEVTYKHFIACLVVIFMSAYVISFGPINWDFSGCGAKCANVGARMAARGSYSLATFYTLFPGGWLVCWFVCMLFFNLSLSLKSYLVIGVSYEYSNCRIPDDHISNRLLKLNTAREVMGILLQLSRAPNP